MANLEDRTRTALAQARAASGLSLAEVSELADISTSTLSRIETGERRLTVDSLDRIAKAIGTTPAGIISVAAQEDELLLTTPPVRLADGMTGVVLRVDEHGRTLLRVTVPQRAHVEDTSVHNGTEWVHVLEGRLALRVGERHVILDKGGTAQFSTAEPHTMGGHGGPVEILSWFEPGAHRA